jgi:carbamoyl-phosphate synthase large subunit
MKKYQKVLLLGSGALKIGEAGEFDYSGSQALKALKEEGIHTILINPNIATVQTTENIADDVYFLPVTPYFVEQVIKKEKPDGIMVAFGGQTALNCAVELYKNNIFEKYNVEVLGTPVRVIMDTEDRDIFVQKLDEINVDTARSLAVESVEEAINAANKIGYPLIVRAAYALGGLGSGFAYNEQELIELTKKSFTYSPQVLVEESLKGWKELEYEVVRDKYGNCVTVCNMENFDPVGVHTGESIVVAPSQTLTNSEYHKLREVAIRTIQHLGVVGECNIQYALHPTSEEYRVIEVNARLSRSSALASKATGYPLAFVAAKLALGYGMYEITNAVTQTTCAFFEPALDYCVVKMPRWDLGKFVGVQRSIGSSMKSVGEIMAIGRSFEEAIQKGIRMLDNGNVGFVGNAPKTSSKDELEKLLSEPNDERIYRIAEAFDQGYSIEEIFQLTKIDHWFLQRLFNIHSQKENLKTKNQLAELSDKEVLELKKTGFSDKQIAYYLFNDASQNAIIKIREERKERNIKPVVKQIDTLAAEFPAKTNYLYVTYHGTENDVQPETEKAVAILGSGVYRIGSSVEFDWGGVIAAQTAAKQGFKTIIINYNPETVSTDYDLSDRLYFEELSFERVMDILEYEQPHGTILSTGGQIPNNLAMPLFNQNIKILGTSPLDIDNAENRHKFSSIMDELEILQPRWKELTTLTDMKKFIDEVGFPVLIRPSYVLSGAAMNVVSNNDELMEFLALAKEVSAEHPVVVSEFIQGAKELELDAVANNGQIICSAISEHVEFAGVHSGDATMYYPPQKMYIETAKRIRKIGEKIAKRFNITGPFNMQFLGKNNELKVIELNLRASRSFPFVSKISGTNFIEKATRVILGENLEPVQNDPMFSLDYVGVKASQFSFTRLQGADPALGVDMSSTGEVGCIAKTAEEALLKSMLSVGYKIPEQNILVSGGPIESKVTLLPMIKRYAEKGFEIFATEGTHHFLAENGIKSTLVFWPDSAKEPNVISKLKAKEIKFVINIPKNLSKTELDNDYKIRRTAVDFNIPLITNARLAEAFLNACDKFNLEDINIVSWKEYKGEK